MRPTLLILMLPRTQPQLSGAGVLSTGGALILVLYHRQDMALALSMGSDMDLSLSHGSDMSLALTMEGG